MSHINRRLLGAAALATLSAAAAAQTTTLEQLQEQIELLQERVAALEAVRFPITMLMPNFAERFHVMHRAGDLSDWAVAHHELEAMRHITEMVKHTEPEKGALMDGMMSASFKKLQEAIEHRKRAPFDKALAEAVDACNACHAATGSEFIKVTLDPDDTLSLRHPHVLRGSIPPMEHHH
jgi:hypothetical protein